jgi:hypothetical protein
LDLVVTRRNAAWCVVFAGSLSILALACISRRSPPPSDEEVLRQFTQDSATYQRVITMLAADTNIGAITADFLWRVGQVHGNASAAEVGITEARLAEYRRLLGALRVSSLHRWAPHEVVFLIWARGFAGNTHHRGIAWLPEPTSPIPWMRFRLIATPWYMFQD